MARSGVRGEGARPRVRQADDLGWDDSLYDENGDPADGGGASGGRGGDATGQGSGSTSRDNGSSRTGGDSAHADGPGAGSDRRNGRPVDKDGDDTSAEPRGQGRHGGGGGRRGGGGDGGHPRRRRRILRWSASVLALLILGTAGAGYLYYQHLNNNIKKDDLNLGDEKDRAAKSKANAAGQTP